MNAPERVGKAQAFISQLTSELVLHERLRQIEKEGFTPDRDDERSRPSGDLALAAATYCRSSAWTAAGLNANDMPVNDWPWSLRDFKPRTQREDLIRAGALILAELERITRAEALKRLDGAES